MMNFEVRAVSPQDFASYIAFRNANPGATNAQALESIGQEPYATTTRPFNSDRTGTRDGVNTTDPSQNV